MTLYFAVWFLLVSELTWLFVHYGLTTFCLLFTVLLAIVIGLMVQDVKRERRLERERHGRRDASRLAA